MFEEKVFADICAIQLIPNMSAALREQYNLKTQSSVGIVTLTLDDVGFVALDEATKAALVDVVYAKSFYGGSDYPSGPLSGEFIGIIAGHSPEEVKSGLAAIEREVKERLYFETINGNQDHLLFAQTISSCGTYFSEAYKVAEGQALAYLIAPPIEAIVGVDHALKTADVEVCELFQPPTETNFAGAVLKGSQAACQAAVSAFRDSVNRTSHQPLKY